MVIINKLNFISHVDCNVDNHKVNMQNIRLRILKNGTVTKRIVTV